MTVIDSHAHVWGEGFLPAAFFRDAAEGWAAKAADRRPDMILPKLLAGVVDASGDDFVANMDSAGVDATFVMMPNCVLDISNWNEHFEADVPGLVARLATWRSLVGPERILFASDQASGARFTGARSHLDRWVAFIRDLPATAARWGYRFTDADTLAILGANARRFYNLA